MPTLFGIWSGALTFILYVRARAVKGTGDYSPIGTAWPGCDTTGMTIIVPNGDKTPLPWRQIVEAIHQHLTSSNLLDYWSAPLGDSSGELRRALEVYDPGGVLGATRSLCVWFDGPNGPVDLSLG